ncbi:MAG: cellulase [Rhodospirillaceae bacterium]|nr:cellulase [Rhodospirillaceae bacterium]
MIPRALFPLVLLALAAPVRAAEPSIVVTVSVDAAADKKPISPLIYGLNYATAAQLAELNVPLNRAGGNSASMYNWRINARNAGRDWFYESLAAGEDIFDQHGESFAALTKEAGAQPMMTVPMIGWVAKLDRDRKPLAGFSIGKYGLQEDFDEHGFAEAGNGRTLDGVPITGNDPNDAAQPDGPEDQREWIRSLVARWGTADKDGIRYYIMDNEPSAWHGMHNHVRPVGAHAQEVADLVRDYAAMVKSVDPAARIVAPEEWGWDGYRYSGFDQQHAVDHGYDRAPDRINQTKGMDYLPWLLTQWKQAGRPVDVVSVHYYPQGGEYDDKDNASSPRIELMRNRSTRDLWDTTYKNPTWINAVVALIPTLRKWVDTYYYPGTPIAITEYNWGAEDTMNGGTTQADILGIFGREGLDMAARWATPPTGSPPYLAFKLYRNYDGKNSAFGDVSVRARTPDPDKVSAFAALRKDGALTLVVINKQLDAAVPVKLDLANFSSPSDAEVWQLAGGNLTAKPAVRTNNGTIALPPQSVTLFVLRGGHG